MLTLPRPKFSSKASLLSTIRKSCIECRLNLRLSGLVLSVIHWFRLVFYRGKDWGGSRAENCKGQTKPVMGSTYPGSSLPQDGIVKSVLSHMSKRVELLDVTLLSQLRKDGHPSVYGGRQSSSDCSHWCLPGVPDTWNQLLYASSTWLFPWRNYCLWSKKYKYK